MEIRLSVASRWETQRVQHAKKRKKKKELARTLFRGKEQQSVNIICITISKNGKRKRELWYILTRHVMKGKIGVSCLLLDSLGFSAVIRLASTSPGWAERHAGLKVHVCPPNATRRSPSAYTFKTLPTWPRAWQTHTHTHRSQGEHKDHYLPLLLALFYPAILSLIFAVFFNLTG